MAKSHNFIHHVEDDRVLQHSIVVKLAKILHLRNPSLEEPKIILLKPEIDEFNNVVNDLDDKFWVIAIQSTKEDGKEMNIAIFDFPRLRKDLLQNLYNLARLSQILQISSTSL